MRPSVYLETTIPSYIAGWLSRDLVTAAHQGITQAWWDRHREEYDLYISVAVLDEARAGDPEASQRRLALLENIPAIEITYQMIALSRQLADELPLPASADVDALHIAVATVGGMDYLLTWNLKHIANVTLRKQIESVCRIQSYEPPIICTPYELMGEWEE
jgi:hypothetical protein